MHYCSLGTSLRRGGEGRSLDFDRGKKISSNWSLSITSHSRKCMLELAQKEVLRLLAQLGLCLEGVLPQRERVQVEQGQELRMLREELDEVSAAYVPFLSKEAPLKLDSHVSPPISSSLRSF